MLPLTTTYKPSCLWLAEGCIYYNASIPLPMSLAIILSRLENKFYRSCKALRRDLRLLAENAAEFNGADSYIAAQAQGGCLRAVSEVIA